MPTWALYDSPGDWRSFDVPLIAQLPVDDQPDVAVTSSIADITHGTDAEMAAVRLETRWQWTRLRCGNAEPRRRGEKAVTQLQPGARTRSATGHRGPGRFSASGIPGSNRPARCHNQPGTRVWRA